MATTKAAKKAVKKKPLAREVTVMGKLTSIRLVKPRGGTIYHVVIEWRFTSLANEWDRETFTIVAPDVERAMNEAIAVSLKDAVNYDPSPIEYRLAEIKEIGSADGIAE